MKIFSIIMMALLLSGFQMWGCNGQINLKNETLYVGFNGVNNYSKKYFYENKESFESSWLKNAMPNTEFVRLVQQVDFSKKFILVYSLGQQFNMSGSLSISTNYIPVIQSTYSYSLIGLNANIGTVSKKECNIINDVESYPFIVALVERPKEHLKFSSGSHANYYAADDRCKTPISGKVTAE